MKTINAYVFILYIVMMPVASFAIFDDMASSIIFGLIFGLSAGGIFSWIFSSRSNKEALVNSALFISSDKIYS